MSSRIVVHPGDPVDAVQNADSTAAMQCVLPMIDKDALDLITISTIALPTFSAPPYNLDTLTKYPILNTGCLHIWGTSAVTPGILQFYIALYAADGTLMSVQPQTAASLNTFTAQDGAGAYHSAGLLDMWIASAAQIGVWVTSVAGGPWNLFIRPY